MNIIKRNGMEVPFDRQKIVTAITKANETVKTIHSIFFIYLFINYSPHTNYITKAKAKHDIIFT